jgi:hypothetical protein
MRESSVRQRGRRHHTHSEAMSSRTRCNLAHTFACTHSHTDVCTLSLRTADGPGMARRTKVRGDARTQTRSRGTSAHRHSDRALALTLACTCACLPPAVNLPSIMRRGLSIDFAVRGGRRLFTSQQFAHSIGYCVSASSPQTTKHLFLCLVIMRAEDVAAHYGVTRYHILAAPEDALVLPVYHVQVRFRVDNSQKY